MQQFAPVALWSTPPATWAPVIYRRPAHMRKVDSEWAASRNVTGGDSSVSLRGSRKGAPMCHYLPAHICPSPPPPLRPPLNGTLALDHLLFLHAWVALVACVEKRKERRKKKKRNAADRLSPLFSLALWCLKCDCSRIVDAFPLEGFDMKSRPGLSGLSHGQWSRTKTISRLTVGYYYQSEAPRMDGEAGRRGGGGGALPQPWNTLFFQVESTFWGPRWLN